MALASRTRLVSTVAGDWLVFKNMGAYTVCAASQFNGFEVSNVIYTSGDGPGSFEVRHVLTGHLAVAGGSGNGIEDGTGT